VLVVLLDLNVAILLYTWEIREIAGAQACTVMRHPPGKRLAGNSGALDKMLAYGKRRPSLALRPWLLSLGLGSTLS